MLKVSTDHPILDAAEACFARHGVRRTTIEDIAAEAGVSRITVYRQIGSRDDIVLEVLLRVTRRFLERIRPRLLASADLGEALTELVMATVRAARRDDILLLYASEDQGARGRPIPGAAEPLFAAFGETVSALQAHLPGSLSEKIATQEAGELVLRIAVSLLTLPSSRTPTGADSARLVRCLLTGGVVATRP